MTDCSSRSSARVRQRRRTIGVILAGVVACIAILLAGAAAGYRVNMTASEPLGLWRMQPLTRPVAVGDLVFICLPEAAIFSQARTRGYLRRGLCPTGDAPLIKMVIAIEGQRVEIGEDVRIDGLRIPATTVVAADGMGRTLDRDVGGTVPAGNVFLYSPFVASWDSRYFGPIPASGVLGLAEEVLTYAP